MNIGVLHENAPLDSRVALTPPVVRHLAEEGNTIWVESGAGIGAMFRDADYLRAGAQIGYSSSEVIRRSEVVVKISVPSLEELWVCEPGTVFFAFYHLAVAGKPVFDALVDHKLTAVGWEIIESSDGRHPVLAPFSEIAGQMSVPLAAHLLRSSSGGRGILLGGSPGVPPANVLVLGAGVVGTKAARAAQSAGARVTVLDVDTERLRRLTEHVPYVATAFAEPESIAAAVASADVLIGAVLVPGTKTPHLVTHQMVETMKPGSVIIDVSVDQGGCIETSRPTTIADPTFVYNKVVHYCVPNMTADMGRSTSTAAAQAMLPYLLELSRKGVEGALKSSPALARGLYTYRGTCVHPRLARNWKVAHRNLDELMGQPSARDREGVGADARPS